MPIIYTCISRGPVILVDYTACSGNFVHTAQEVLKYCKPEKKYAEYSVQAYVFYIAYLEGLIYMCMCDLDYKKRIAFPYLEDIRKIFCTTFTPQVIDKANLYGLSKFSLILKEKMDLYSSPENVDKIEKLRRETEELVEISRENLDKTIARGQKITVLVQKTKVMSTLSLDFKNNSKVKQHR